MLEKIFTWLAAYATPILLAAMFAAGAGLGWMANGWRWESRVVALERDAARREATLSDEIVQALELTLKAERRGDELVAALIAAQDERSILAREKDDAIRKNT
ncbi:MAG: hypothetical protein LBJ59_10875, partial [Zoogloeaceae bacterium]|nr:hypothetical protein [Zoogloeaceae bacterium]